MPNEALQNGERQIPGFYYDAEKKRYFKIAHTASGGAYTASSVAKRIKLDQVALQEAARAEAVTKAKAAYKPLKLPPALQCTLDRSIGRLIGPLPAQIWNASLRLHKIKNRLLNSSGQRTKVAFNEAGRELYVASGLFIEAHDFKPVRIGGEEDSDLPHNLSRRRMMPIAPLRSAISSLHAQNSTMFATSIGEGSRPAEAIVRTEYGGRISTVDGTLWCSAVRPDTTLFAAGGSTVLLYDVNRIDDGRREVKIQGKSEVKAMDFLDNNILALGARNGSVHLYDVRTHNATTSLRFKHRIASEKQGVGIVNIKALHSQGLIISGLRHTLCQYDMRFLKDDRPLVTYPHHKNEYDINVDALAVNGNVLAVAQAERNFNLWSITGDFLGTKSTARQVDDLLFPQLSDHADDLLWTVSYCNLDEWSFDPSC